MSAPETGTCGKDPNVVKIAAWMVNGRTGASSKVMAAWLGFGVRPTHAHWPWDAADFGRCVGLLDAVPELRDRLSHLADLGPEWAEITARWHLIEAEYRAGRMTAARKLISAAISAGWNAAP